MKTVVVKVNNSSEFKLASLILRTYSKGEHRILPLDAGNQRDKEGYLFINGTQNIGYIIRYADTFNSYKEILYEDLLKNY